MSRVSRLHYLLVTVVLTVGVMPQSAWALRAPDCGDFERAAIAKFSDPYIKDALRVWNRVERPVNGLTGRRTSIQLLSPNAQSAEGYQFPPLAMICEGAPPTVLVAEALEQLPVGTELTHVLVQGGVGGLAGAVCAHLWDVLGEARPLFVVVEPQGAACLQASARAGALGSLEAVEETVMTGLACGTPSSLAWRVLDTGADAYVSISDLHTSDGMRALAGGAGDPPVVAGASGAAGVGALRAIASDQVVREALGLSRESVVLVIGTEGASDPELYRRTVGRSAEQILS